MMSLEQVIDAVVYKLDEDCKAYKMMPEYSNQKSEFPLTRRERRALKRKKKKHGR